MYLIRSYIWVSFGFAARTARRASAGRSPSGFAKRTGYPVRAGSRRVKRTAAGSIRSAARFSGVIRAGGRPFSGREGTAAGIFAFHGFLHAGRPCASPRGGFSFQRPAAGLSGDRRGGAAKRVFGSSPQDGGDAFASYSAVYIRVFRKESGTQCRAAQSRAAH